MKKMTNRISVAVVMTVFNRKEKTEKCIKSIIKETENDSISLDFYITNDCSTDGTEELLKYYQKNYPNNSFVILSGSGNLFWNKGMYLSYGEALKKKYDFYLWVNNDVEFSKGFLLELIKDYNKARRNQKFVIICGAVRYRDKNELSYGGAVNYSKINPYKRLLLVPNGNIQKCDCINGNCLLIPGETGVLVGNVDERYEHGFGDFDYGYKLIKYGGQPYVASNFVGMCDRNSTVGSWKDSSLPLKMRFELKNKPIGQPPYSHKIFLRKWFPKFWFYYWIKPYVRIICSSLINKIRKR